MAAQSISSLFSSDPFASINADCMFEVAGDLGAGVISGAVKASVLKSFFNKPQLPAWTYTAGAIGAGLFTTDNVAVASTTVITLSSSVLGDDSAWINSLVVGSRLLFVNEAGLVSVFIKQSSADPDVTLTVTCLRSPETNWSGAYTLSIFPYRQTAADVGAATTAQGALADTALQPNGDGSGLSNLPVPTFAEVLGAGGDAGNQTVDSMGNINFAEGRTFTIFSAYAFTVPIVGVDIPAEWIKIKVGSTDRLVPVWAVPV